MRGECTDEAESLPFRSARKCYNVPTEWPEGRRQAFGVPLMEELMEKMRRLAVLPIAML